MSVLGMLKMAAIEGESAGVVTDTFLLASGITDEGMLEPLAQAAISLSDLWLIQPLLLLMGGVLLVMIQAAIRRHHATAVVLTVLTLLLSIGCLAQVAGSAALERPQLITALIQVDAFVLCLWALLLLTALLVTALAWHYWRDQQWQMEALYILLLSATLGACVLVASRHFAALFIGLELMTISLIGMLGYPVSQSDSQARAPLEAALKYLVLSAVASAILLFGMALIYATTGSLEFSSISGRITPAGQTPDLYLLMGIALLVAGLGFKLSLVPFHLWTPDVYQGAPLPVTAFIASLSKVAVLAVLLRFVLMADGQQQPVLLNTLSLLAVASMLVGNLLALLQDNPKRLLAYSSIAHMGYVMLALLLPAPYAAEAATFYLIAYALMTLGVFSVLSLMSRAGAEPTSIEDLRGLCWQQPLLGLCMTVMLLSLAGIPLTIGFIGKFYLVAAAVQAELWLPLAALIIGSVLGLYYYLLIVVVMLTVKTDEDEYRSIGTIGYALLLLSITAVFALGIFPDFVMESLRKMSVLIS